MKRVLTIFILILTVSNSFSEGRDSHKVFLQKIKEFEKSSNFHSELQKGTLQTVVYHLEKTLRFN